MGGMQPPYLAALKLFYERKSRVILGKMRVHALKNKACEQF